MCKKAHCKFRQEKQKKKKNFLKERKKTSSFSKEKTTFSLKNSFSVILYIATGIDDFGAYESAEENHQIRMVLPHSCEKTTS